MKLRLLVVGTRPPRWVKEGYDEYARRMPAGMKLTLDEIPAASQFGGDAKRRKASEGDKLLKRLHSADHVVALDEGGRQLTTAQLAKRMNAWRQQGSDVAFLVGGADGLADKCLERSHERWSLSKLTFPHAMVRIIVAEQLYRAQSILLGHPYHRA